MKLKEHHVSDYVKFLDHWVYELKRIYEGHSDSEVEFWLTSKKNERMNIFSNTITKMVLKVLNFKKPEQNNEEKCKTDDKEC